MSELFRARAAVNIVGKRAIRELHRIAAYLSYAFPPLITDRENSGAFDSRLAPSVVARSEVLLLNLDLPRFCLRVYLDATHRKSFVNLRRVREALDRVLDYEWLNYDGPIAINDVGAAGAEAGAIFRETLEPLPAAGRRGARRYLTDSSPSAVADCLLRPPDAVAAKFDVVYAELGWVYGEQDRISGVPYVRPMAALGGSACAQCCAFMVSALLAGRADAQPGSSGGSCGVHGLVEITALTSPPSERFLKLGALRGHSLLRYFAAVGYSAFHFCWTGEEGPCVRDLFRCVSIHVRSGFGCILPCSSLGLDVVWDHAVVAVGTPKWVNGHSRINFLVNNPEGRPFEQWDTGQIRERVLRRVDTASDQGSAVVVLPGAVRVPLMKASAYRGESSLVLGALELARAHDVGHPQSRRGLAETWVTQFHLHRIQLERKGGEERVAFPPEGSGVPRDTAFRDLWQASPILRSLAGHWCWIQVRPNDVASEVGAVSLWDAERNPLNLKFAKTVGATAEFDRVIEQFLLVQFRRHGGGGTWELNLGRHGAEPRFDTKVRDRERYERTEGRARVPESRDKPNRRYIGFLPKETQPLQPALITSFSANHLKEAFAAWPKGVGTADLYAFMHRDDELLKPLHEYLPARDPKRAAPSTAALLSAVQRADVPDSKRRAVIHKLAKNVHEHVKEYAPRVRVGAFASYLPQIFSHQADQSLQGMRALLTLLELAEALRGRGHDVRTVEIVGGSTIEGLIPGRAGGEEFLVAKRRVGSEVPKFVLDKLSQVCQMAGARLGSDFFQRTSISLELEPGPLFPLNDTGQLLTFAKAIAADPVLSPAVGLNVDVAHCALAGIDPKVLFGTPEIASRISHFHVSDHGTGHFGDAPIGDCGLGAYAPTPADRLAVFEPWIAKAWAFAVRRQERERHTKAHTPRFSGLISVELEAAFSASAVQRSCDALGYLLELAKRQPLAPV